jgi:MFS family permease
VSGRLLADITPLRESSAFRRLWFSGLLSNIGNQMTAFAVALQVYLISHSSLAVGAVGLSAALPAIAVGLLGGSLIDAVDRRRLVLITSGLLALVSIGFAVQAFAEFDQLWLLYLLTALTSSLSALNSPAQSTFILRLLPLGQVPAGTALTMLVVHTSFVVGPSVAGVLAATGGLKLCYLVDALGFGAALYGVARLPAMPPHEGGSGVGLAAAIDGLRLLRRDRLLSGALLADLNATVLGIPIALFPAINAERFGGSPRTLGVLTAAIAVGGILGSSLSGPVSRVRYQGRGMLIAGGIWGAAIAGFGLVHGLAASLCLLVIAGAADVSSVVLRTTIIQLASPTAYIGRVNAAQYVVGTACPQLGNFRAGAVGSLTSPGLSATLGGVASVVGTIVISLAVPALTRYRAAADARSVHAGTDAVSWDHKA